MDVGSLNRFGPLNVPPAFTLPFAAPVEEAAFLNMARDGFAVNAEAFREFPPGTLLLNSLRRGLDGAVTAGMTPLPKPAREEIRRADFTEFFGSEAT